MRLRTGCGRWFRLCFNVPRWVTSMHGIGHAIMCDFPFIKLCSGDCIPWLHVVVCAFAIDFVAKIHCDWVLTVDPD